MARKFSSPNFHSQRLGGGLGEGKGDDVSPLNAPQGATGEWKFDLWKPELC